MATLITDKNRNLLLPKSDFLSGYWDCKFYSLPWATTESPQLLFDNFSTLLALETSQEFQIWYSEDLFKWGTALMGSKKRVLQCICLSSRPNYKVNWRRECQNCCSCLYYFNIRQLQLTIIRSTEASTFKIAIRLKYSSSKCYTY